MSDRATVMEMLNNSNYLTWSIKMKMVLIRKNCWSVVKEAVPALMELEEMKRLADKDLMKPI